METLERVLESRAIPLVEHVTPDLKLVVGTDAENERVEGSMVDRAHRHYVRHYGLAAVRVLLDVGRVEQPRMPEPAQRALRPVREQHAISEHALVQPLLHQRLRVSAHGIEPRSIAQTRPPRVAHRLVKRHDELLVLRFLAGQPDREPGPIDPGPHPDEPNQRPLKIHRPPEADVVGMMRVGPSPLVAGIAVRAFFVVVGRHFPRTDVRGEDAQRGLEEPRPPDPLLWSDQSNRPSLEDEGLELRPGDKPSRPVGSRPEVGERRPSEPFVEVGIHGSARMAAPFVEFKPSGPRPLPRSMLLYVYVGTSPSYPVGQGPVRAGGPRGRGTWHVRGPGHSRGERPSLSFDQPPPPAGGRPHPRGPRQL